MKSLQFQLCPHARLHHELCCKGMHNLLICGERFPHYLSDAAANHELTPANELLKIVWEPVIGFSTLMVMDSGFQAKLFLHFHASGLFLPRPWSTWSEWGEEHPKLIKSTGVVSDLIISWLTEKLPFWVSDTLMVVMRLCYGKCHIGPLTNDF